MAKSIKCLIVEDSEFDLLLLVAALQRGGYEPVFERVQTDGAMRAALRRQEWDVIFCDYVMPQFDALSAFRVFRESGRQIPFIIVSGEIGENVAVESLKFGASDYVLKNNLQRLVPSLKRALKETENLRERNAIQDLNDLIMANSLDMICTLDPQFRFTMVSTASRDILKYETPELIGRKFTDLVHSEDIDLTVKELGDIMADHVPTYFENRCIRKDNSTVDLVWSVRWSLAKQLFFCVARDVTNSQYAEAALQRNEAMFQMMVEQVADYAILTLNPAGKIKTWNIGAARMKGYQADEIIGQSFEQFYPPEDIAAGKPSHLLGEAMAKGRVADEAWLIRKDGLRFWASVVITAVRDEQGELYGFTNVTHDLTHRKRGEEERQMMELRLRQAQKLEAIGQLAAGIAHEINTPTQFTEHNLRFLMESYPNLLKLAKGCSSLLPAAEAGPIPTAQSVELRKAIQDADLDFLADEIPRAIDEALQGTGRITEIVRAMKEFSHPGGDNNQPELANINRALETTITVARNEWKHVAEMATEWDSALPPVPLFVGEFNQAILNLLVNAAHAITDANKGSSSKKGVITVRTRRDGDCVEVRIRDNGTGIPEKVRHRIFEPFFTTKEVGRGTGQGLAIVRSVIVEKHHGSLEFETETGKGTCFVLRLPLKPPPTSPKDTNSNHDRA